MRCSALDECERILSRSRYIAGDALTEADVRLFVTLIRFDEVYVVYFKTNKKFIHQYEHLSGHACRTVSNARVSRDDEFQTHQGALLCLASAVESARHRSRRTRRGFGRAARTRRAYQR